MHALIRDLTPPLVKRARYNMKLKAEAKKAAAVPSGARLHFGCGPNIKPGWVNIDLANPAADLHLDLSRPLPFDDELAAFVYSEHFLEHLDYPEPAGLFVRECYRVLAHGGVFSVGVPDTEWPLKSYAQGHDFKRESEARHWHPDWCETEIEHINFHFRQGTQHRFAYDYETLERMLARCGFVDIRRRDYDPGLDLEHRAFGTLYAEARKP